MTAQSLDPLPNGDQPAGFQVRLDVFEGPFDLLLALISERRVDVCDVPIAQLTTDYLAHIDHMREMDLDPATEFLVVAATLLQLKARALLPADEPDDPYLDDTDTERDVLIAHLLEVRTFQAAGKHLAELIAHGDRFAPAAPAPDDPAFKRLPTLADIDASTLATTLVELVREGMRVIDTSLLLTDEIPTAHAVELVTDRLREGTTTFRALAQDRPLPWGVAIFCAILELAMRGEVELGQAERLGDIEIIPREERP